MLTNQEISQLTELQSKPHLAHIPVRQHVDDDIPKHIFSISEKNDDGTYMVSFAGSRTVCTKEQARKMAEAIARFL